MTVELTAPYGGDPDAWISWADGLGVSQAIGLRCSAIAEGEVEMVLEHSIMGLNPNGAVHGGLVALAVDQVMGIVVTSALPADHVAVTATLSMEYHAPAMLPLVFRGRTSRIGRGIAYAEVDVHGRDDSLCSRGRASMVPRRAVPGLPAVRH